MTIHIFNWTENYPHT